MYLVMGTPLVKYLNVLKEVSSALATFRVFPGTSTSSCSVGFTTPMILERRLEKVSAVMRPQIPSKRSTYFSSPFRLREATCTPLFLKKVAPVQYSSPLASQMRSLPLYSETILNPVTGTTNLVSTP
ncbi:hypothetical protein BEWA_049710 [Theileria equi strain WA]|uniref:Uncharacterized protein n=1 Tax=Theileria equi strain WA TaxID=1537102 RepID=L1LB57_THEEQ|nr:hypothetical protein BEWA_049710 [Theileria equi strain WA]EKX72504.1 hypothetical protein BEWA_049710 [Theileria equi strain WA]|eukprot:XP_004831956.1 hypothetical protein BEWA_049710 [Theileria equi strain WA]